MRGFVVSLEALLAFLLLLALLAFLFLPGPNTLGISTFLLKNDEITALMEKYFPGPGSRVPGAGADCMNVRYYLDRSGALQEICVR